MKYLNFSVVIEEDSRGFFAFCPELQGCYSQGKNYEEVLKNIKDAIELHIKDRVHDKEKLERPKSISLVNLEVAT